jgi:Flp pilus assembly protein TadB
MAFRNKSECANMTPVWRRSTLECGMRSPTTRFEVAVIVVFLIVIVVALVYLLPGFLGSH